MFCSTGRACLRRFLVHIIAGQTRSFSMWNVSFRGYSSLQPRAGNGRLLRRPPPWRLCAHRDAHSARVAFTGTAGRAMRQHAPLITTRPKRRLVSRLERERLATRGRQAKGSGRFGLGSARAGASPPNSGTDLTTGREAVV